MMKMFVFIDMDGMLLDYYIYFFEVVKLVLMVLEKKDIFVIFIISKIFVEL